jgi:hypothetical protein
MEVVTDKELLEIYYNGWDNELNTKSKSMHFDNKKKAIYLDKLKQRAYDLGRVDAFAGDEVSSIDLQSDEEILKSIKN